MPSFDFLLGFILKIFGLKPIFPRKCIYLNYASFIYTGVILLLIIYGEFDYIYSVYFRNIYSDILKVEGVTKYTYFARDFTGVLFSTVNLIGSQVFHLVRNKAESKLTNIDKYLNIKLKRLRISVVFCVVFFAFWFLISLLNVILMKPRSFSRLFSLTVGTIDAFTIIDFTDQLYLRFLNINMQLESLLNDCKKTNKIEGIYCESRDIQRIRVMGKCHVELCQIVDKMKGNFGLSMIVVILVIYMNTISFSVYFLFGGVKDKNTEVLIIYAFLVILNIILAYFLLYKGTQLSDEAYGIRNIVWNNMNFPLEPAIVSELEIIVLKTGHRNWRIDCGYFELSLDTFGSMANSILTQVVIIYTFQ